MFRIDPQSGVPIYHQVTEQFRRMIAAGTLLAGDRLPTVRELAAELIVNPNTVARAYQDLERAGIVETRRGLGTFACEPGQRLSPGERRLAVAALMDRALAEASMLGFCRDDVLPLWQERVAVWHGAQEEKEANR